MYGVQFTVGYAGSELSPESIGRGGFLSRGDARTILLANETRGGSVAYGETRIDTDTGMRGNGTLATATFGIAGDAEPGRTSIELRGVKLVTPDSEVLDTSTRNHTVEIRSQSSGSGQPRDGPGGDVRITERELLNTTVSTGDRVVARVALSNFSPAEGRIDLNLSANGSALVRRTVSVGASTDRTVFLRYQFAEPGRYVVALNGVSVGTVVVAEGPTPTATTRTGTPTSTVTTGSRERTPTVTEGETTTATSTPDTPETTTGDGAGFGPVGVVAVVVALRLFARGE